jgi:hypothetical protein
MPTQSRNYRRLRTLRITSFRKNRGKSSTEIMQNLRDEGLVSVYYNDICLSVDTWFLFEKRRNFYKSYANFCTISNPYKHIWLRIIIQALADYGGGRPCDEFAWSMDLPPDDLKCSPSYHICKSHAKLFLLSISDFEEEFAGLRTGTIREFMSKLNGSSNDK